MRDKLIAAFNKPVWKPKLKKPWFQLAKEASLGFENVMARLKGTGSVEAVLLACHYDSMPGSFGAVDDGSGLATLLEVLQSPENRKIDFNKTLFFLLQTVKSWALSGAKAFVSHHPWAAEVKHVINLEAKGTSGPATMFRNQPWQLKPYSSPLPLLYSYNCQQCLQ